MRNAKAYLCPNEPTLTASIRLPIRVWDILEKHCAHLAHQRKIPKVSRPVGLADILTNQNYQGTNEL